VLDPTPATIDGVTLAETNRVLVKNQAVPAQNGIYKKDGTALVRADDYATDAFVAGGLKVYVQEGTANAKKTFRMFTTGVIDVGTTSTSWEEDGGGGGGTLAATLVLGNLTGGTDIVLTAADALAGSAGAPLLITPNATEAVELGTGHTTPNGLAGTTIMGRSHTANAVDATVGGFTHNVDDNAYGASVFGKSNTAGPGAYHAFMAGRSNTVRNLTPGDYGVDSGFAIGASGLVQANNGYGAYFSGVMGISNAVIQASNSFAMGSLCNVYGYDATVLTGVAGNSLAGGSNTDVSSHATFAWGRNSTTHERASGAAVFGENRHAYVSGQLLHGATSVATYADTVGGAQAEFFSMACATTNATVTNATTTGSATESTINRLNVRVGHTITFIAEVLARQTGGGAGTIGDYAVWNFRGTITRDLAGNTTLNLLSVLQSNDLALNGGGNVVADIYESTLATAAPPTDNIAAAAAWRAEFVANDTNEALRLQVTGEASKNIVWITHIVAAEAGKIS
jgi:hypothetical protein